MDFSIFSTKVCEKCGALTAHVSPLCNLLNNSMTSNDVDRKKKKSENVSGRGRPSSIEIHFYEIMVSRDNDMCYSELLW